MSAGPYGALLDAVRGVRWPSARRIAGATLGAHASRLKGNSSEFSEFRPYRQGDDPRRVDWRLLARSDRAYVRLTTDRATFGTGMIVDASASMAFPLPALDKWRLARELAVGLASVAHAEGDPVGLAVSGDEAGAIHPRARRSVVIEMIRALDATSPAGDASLSPLVAGSRARRVVVISDFLGDADDVLTQARLRVAQGGEVVLVHVVATEELDPPGDAVLAVDPERSQDRRILDGSVRGRYREQFTRWQEALGASARSAGIGYLRALTGEPAAHAIRRVAAYGSRRGA